MGQVGGRHAMPDCSSQTVEIDLSELEDPEDTTIFVRHTQDLVRRFSKTLSKSPRCFSICGNNRNLEPFWHESQQVDAFFSVLASNGTRMKRVCLEGVGNTAGGFPVRLLTPMLSAQRLEFLWLDSIGLLEGTEEELDSFARGLESLRNLKHISLDLHEAGPGLKRLLLSLSVGPAQRKLENLRLDLGRGNRFQLNSGEDYGMVENLLRSKSLKSFCLINMASVSNDLVTAIFHLLSNPSYATALKFLTLSMCDFDLRGLEAFKGFLSCRRDHLRDVQIGIRGDLFQDEETTSGLLEALKHNRTLHHIQLYNGENGFSGATEAAVMDLMKHNHSLCDMQIFMEGGPKIDLQTRLLYEKLNRLGRGRFVYESESISTAEWIEKLVAVASDAADKDLQSLSLSFYFLRLNPSLCQLQRDDDNSNDSRTPRRSSFQSIHKLVLPNRRLKLGWTRRKGQLSTPLPA